MALQPKLSAASAGTIFYSLWRALEHAAGDQPAPAPGNCAERIFTRLGTLSKNGGWQLKPEKTLVSSYDAIRVWLWVGMMHDSDPQKARLLARLKPMATLTAKKGIPPEKVDVATGKPTGQGPVGFSAALLPFLQNRDAQAAQRQRVADNFPGDDAYYSYVLTLFGQGWDQHRFVSP